MISSLLFSFGDGQVVSDLTVTIALLSSLLTIYCFTVLLPCVRVKLLRLSRHWGNKAKQIKASGTGGNWWRSCHHIGSRKLGHSLLIVVAYQKRTEQRCVKLAGQSEMSDGYQRRNLCCRKEVKRVSIDSTCIPFRGAILYIPACPLGLPVSEN